MIKAVSFSGIAPAYQNKSKQQVIPIAQNPTAEDISRAIAVTKATTNPISGYNGEVFWLGKDLVVKRYKGENAFSNDPDREINILNTMYDTGLRLNNSQAGRYAFKTPDNVAYLVSTRVEGKNPSYPENPFTRENLASLVNIITQMDIGRKLEGSSKHGYSDRCRFMNYDFNGHNINVTAEKTGLFDFEYSVIENIDDMIKRTIIDGRGKGNCHRSDTSSLPSSLRSFEFYTFCDYLKSAENASKLFEDYLEIKSGYHANMAKVYKGLKQESKFPEVASLISEKEDAHSRLLAKRYDGRIAEDIKTAEAIKIQMSNFMHEQSKFCNTGVINPTQLRNFTNNAIEYLKAQYVKSIINTDIDRVVYYMDCLELFDDWKSVNETLSEKLANKDPKTLSKLIDYNVPTLLDIMQLEINS